ncbi:ABC transporter permease [Thalassobaculum fulvum]|uniref:ABC transporter permease n=1 Tax=Thalassobaculum fulvum TaxID=1633335 RepID=A0A919CRH8_9PROT|nr:ABC transporter permease [Thalassobaculum fulvum]GHD53883.1 ABC transporter permease [Thalassobaculum fulvum]
MTLAFPSLAEADRRPSRALKAWRRIPLGIRLCFLVAALLVLAAALAPWVSPMDPDHQSLLSRLRPPVGFERAKAGYLLGTDQLGRDVLSRCIHGLTVTLGMAALGATISLTLGTGLGLLSGYVGGRVDDAIMAVVDIQIAVPFTLVALLVVAIAGTGVEVLILVLGIAYWEQYARIVRGQVLALRSLPFVEAGRAIGMSNSRLLFRHILPNVASPIIVQATLVISNLILLESSLSFLGLGIQPPTASLGSMVGQGRDYMASAPWIVAAPALLIVAVALVVLLIGDWLRDSLDVRLSD